MSAGYVTPQILISIIKLIQATEDESDGLKYLQRNMYTTALKYFDKIILTLKDENGFVEELQPKRKTVLASGYLNAAICHLKLEMYSEAVDACDNALFLKPRDGEILFYLAQGCMKIGGYGEAAYIFKMVRTMEKHEEDCTKYIQQCQDEIAKHPNFVDLQYENGCWN